MCCGLHIPPPHSYAPSFPEIPDGRSNLIPRLSDPISPEMTFGCDFNLPFHNDKRRMLLIGMPYGGGELVLPRMSPPDLLSTKRVSKRRESTKGT